MKGLNLISITRTGAQLDRSRRRQHGADDRPYSSCSVLLGTTNGPKWPVTQSTRASRRRASARAELIAEAPPAAPTPLAASPPPSETTPHPQTHYRRDVDRSRITAGIERRRAPARTSDAAGRQSGEPDEAAPSGRQATAERDGGDDRPGECGGARRETVGQRTPAGAGVAGRSTRLPMGESPGAVRRGRLVPRFADLGRPGWVSGGGGAFAAG